jgi:hypothetical protein
VLSWSPSSLNGLSFDSNHSHILKRQSPPASNDSDPQTSLTLHPSVIARGFATNAPPSEDGQVSSLTSTNNFINFCLPTLLDYPITDGKQIRTGSCNPAPMGYIPSTDNMPSVKFMYPRNNDVIDESTTFTIQLKTKNLETGNFVNPMAHYYSAPRASRPRFRMSHTKRLQFHPRATHGIWHHHRSLSRRHRVIDWYGPG